MNNIQIKPYNPYFQRSFMGKLVSKNTLPKLSYLAETKEDKFLPERVVAFGEKWLAKDLEKYVDRINVVVLAADYSLFGFSGILQVSVIVDYIFRKYFNITAPAFLYVMIPALIRMVSIPFRMAFIFFAFLEGFFECICVKRTATLISKISDPHIDLEKRLKWLQEEYSSLTPKEIRSIFDYVEWKNGQLSTEEKGKYFQIVADKYLSSKFESLKRRISPWLAKEIHDQLPTILENIKSRNMNVREMALEHAENIIQDISTQGEKQIFLCLLALGTIIFTIMGMASTFVLSGGTVLIAFTLIATLIMITRYVLAKGMLPERGWHFSIDNVLPKISFSFFQSKASPQK